jgi:hypothetical protein
MLDDLVPPADRVPPPRPKLEDALAYLTGRNIHCLAKDSKFVPASAECGSTVLNDWKRKRIRNGSWKGMEAA